MKEKYLAPSLLFIAFFAVYFAGSFSRIPFGDCVGFVLGAEKGKFINSTSTYAHFLFVNTLVFFKNIFPWAESREIGRFTVIISSCISLLILYFTVLHITFQRFSSIFATIIFGFSFSFWRNSEIVEIYTFNLVFVALFIWLSLMFIQKQKPQLLYFAALILGISLFSHIQNVLLLPAFFMLLRKVNLKQKLSAIAVFVLLFLTLISFQLFNGEGIAKIFSSGVVLSTINIAGILKSFAIALAYLVYNFWYFILLLVPGLIYLWRNFREISYFLIISALPIFAFSVIFSVSDNYVFFIPFNFMAALVVGVGIFSLRKYRFTKILVFSSLFVPLFYLTTFHAASRIEKAQQFDQEKAYKGGLRYYMLPWMNDNVGIVNFTLKKNKSPEPIDWMTRSAEEFIEILKEKGYTEQEISEQ